MMRLPALLTLGLLAALSWTLTQGQTCQLVEISNSKGDDNAISRVESIGFEDCKTLCLSLDTCKALEQRSATTCILFSSDTAFPSSGDTLLQKVCTVAPACTLSNTADLDGDSPAVTLALSIEDSCKKVCNSIAECMAFVFRSSPAECKLLESVPTTTATVGSVYSKKIQSGSGPSCEFERSENMDVPSSASSTSLTNSARSCAELCLAISNCLAVSYNPNGGLCKLFTSTPMTTASSGVTLYEKSCSSSDTATFTTTDVCNDSADTATFTTTDVCNDSGSKTTPHPTFLVSVIVLTLILS